MRAAVLSRGYRPSHAWQAGAVGRVVAASSYAPTGAGSACTSRCSRVGMRAGCVPAAAFVPAWLTLSSWPCWAARPCRCGSPLGGGMSCAVHARALAFSYPDGEAGTGWARPARDRRRARGPAQSQRRRQDSAHAPPERASAWGQRARGGGLGRRRRQGARAARSRRAGVSGPRRPAVHADRGGGRGVPDRSTSGSIRTTAEARVRDALAAVRMTAAAARAPFQLSMGERRRVAIATVLAMHPRLLVLDEPSASLDPRARRRADRGAGDDRPHHARGHPRPAAGCRAVRTRDDPFPGRRSCRRPQPRAAGRRQAACRARPRAAGRRRPGARPPRRERPATRARPPSRCRFSSCPMPPQRS